MKHRIQIVLLLICSIFAMIICASCSNIGNPDRITDYYFVSCTQGTYKGNTFHIREDSLGKKWKGKLKSPEAKELIQEVSLIPDLPEAGDEPAYIIRISYVEDGIEKTLEKTGYDAFPDNWDGIIDLTNTVLNGYTEVTGNKDILRIDADYLRGHCDDLDESVLADDMSLDDVIANAPITFMTLYDPDKIDVRVQDVIVDYLYGYYGLRDRQLSAVDNNPEKSTTEEMNAFAEAHLDEVYWDYATSYCCGGTYNGEDYTVIKYDELQNWLSDYDGYWTSQGFETAVDGYLIYRAERRDADGGAYVSDSSERYVFLDPTGKFIILTNCKKPHEIADVLS